MYVYPCEFELSGLGKEHICSTMYSHEDVVTRRLNKLGRKCVCRLTLSMWLGSNNNACMFVAIICPQWTGWLLCTAWHAQPCPRVLPLQEKDLPAYDWWHLNTVMPCKLLRDFFLIMPSLVCSFCFSCQTAHCSHRGRGSIRCYRQWLTLTGLLPSNCAHTPSSGLRDNAQERSCRFHFISVASHWSDKTTFSVPPKTFQCQKILRSLQCLFFIKDGAKWSCAIS